MSKSPTQKQTTKFTEKLQNYLGIGAEFFGEIRLGFKNEKLKLQKKVENLLGVPNEYEISEDFDNSASHEKISMLLITITIKVFIF